MSRSPYNGSSQGLVLAMDFGTTFSGVSYARLDPGDIPRIQSVVGFEGQEYESGSTKVPSILFYDRNGRVRARGAEIHDPETVLQAREEEWTRVEWLKLLFRPRDRLIDVPETTLPRGKTAVKVLGDFLEYLKLAAEVYIKANEADGDTLWAKLEDEIIYVLSHPNGWDGTQQSQLRNAAILGGLIPQTDPGRARIRFVSEGEASFHWCVEKGLAAKAFTVGANFIVADAGGGTIDVSSFRVTSNKPLQVEETTPADCRLAGSAFITHRFKDYVKEKLSESAYGDEDTLKHLVDEFDRKAKRIFRERSRKTFIPFGNPRDHELAFDIRSGQLVVSGSDMEDLFEPSCHAVAEAIRAQSTPGVRATVFLVGGFAASPWLYNETQRRLLDRDLLVKKAESHTAKAVAEGAIGFYLDQYVVARVAKVTYGVHCARLLNNLDPEHRRRLHLVTQDISGRKYVGGGFEALVTKGTVVHGSSVNKSEFIQERASKEDLVFSSQLVCYGGEKRNLEWNDEDPGKFKHCCTYSALIPARCAERRVGPFGIVYWVFEYTVVVVFGTTEFSCYAEWVEDGELQQGPASIIWEEP